MVVPFYAVEQYLAECLDSLRDQTYRRLQIILVDDGSPDASLDIAQTFAALDPRVEILRQPNQGLGAARNAGVGLARGDYLCFVDSDDTLPPDAIAVLVASLEHTGSDFAVGGLSRLVGDTRQVPPWAATLHARDRLGIGVADYPAILRNVFAWNKLFRRDFYRRVVGGFPEGIRYEDQEPIARAYVGGRFDVLRAVVYDWRKREDGSSVTQQRADPANLADRLLVNERTADLFAQKADPAVFAAWLAKALGNDLRVYLEQVPAADPAYWNQLRDGVRRLAERAGPDDLLAIPILDRLGTLALLADQRDDVVELLVRREQDGISVPGRMDDDGIARLEASYLDGLVIRPAGHLLHLAPSDLRAVAVLTDWSWTASALRIEGYAYLTNVPSTRMATRIGLTAVSASGRRRDIPVSYERRDDLELRLRDAWNPHAESGFSAEAPVDRGGLDPAETWTLEVTVDRGPIRRSARLVRRDGRGSAAVLPVRAADPTGRWTVGIVGEGADGVIRLRHLPPPAVLVRELEVAGAQLTLTLDPPPATVIATSPGWSGEPIGAVVTSGQPGRLSLTLPPLEGDSDDRTWRPRAMLDQKSQKLAFAGGDRDLTIEPGAITVRLQTDGTLSLRQRIWAAVVDDVEVQGDELVVSGRLGGSIDPQAVVTLAAGEVSVELVTEVDPGRGSFRAVADVGTLPPDGPNAYVFSVRGAGVTNALQASPSESLLARLPVDLVADRVAVTVVRRRSQGGLGLRLSPALPVADRGRFRQRRLRDTYRRDDRQVTDSLLFESAGGRGMAGSPLVLLEEFRRREARAAPRPVFWSVDDLRRPVPVGTTALLRDSAAWSEVLATARDLVTDGLFPPWFRKRPGTPILPIGRDVRGARLATTERAALARQVAAWDLLVAQSDGAAERLRSALDYSGPVLVDGCPRTDPLVGADAAGRRAQARRALGIGGDQRLVAYVPEPRYSAASPTGRSSVDLLDADLVRSRLGPGTVVVSAAASTARPDDLLLAADVLVSDYSSTVVDICLTGTPVVFLVPDLVAVQAGGGLYLDYTEATLPGPRCQDTAEVIDWLADPDRLRARFAERYTAFRAAWAPYDDGAVARRVADAVWPGLGPGDL